MFMDETVNEPDLFSEADFADAQTENESSPAVEETNEQPTSENDATESTEDSTNANESQTGDEIEEFLAKKGIKLNDPDALRKVADMYRNVEKDYGKKSQEKAQLERQLEQLNAQQLAQTTPSADPMERVQALERQLAADRQLAAVKDWKAAKNLSPEVEAKMVEFLSQPLEANGIRQTDNNGNPLTKMFLVQAGALSYDDVFRAVGGESFKADAVKQELKTAVANEIAAKQNAKSPSSLATDSTQFAQPKTADDEFIAGLFDE